MSIAFWYKIKHSGFGYKFLRHAKREKRVTIILTMHYEPNVVVLGGEYILDLHIRENEAKKG